MRKKRKRKAQAKGGKLYSLIALVASLPFGYLSYPALSSLLLRSDSVAETQNPQTETENLRYTEHSSESYGTPDQHAVFIAHQASVAANFVGYQEEVLPLFETYCYDCHMDGSVKGGLDLESFSDLESMLADRETWAEIRDHLNWNLMPPIKKDQPTPEEKTTITKWINDTVFAVDPNRPDPGPIAARRMNQAEYKNTIRDLLFVDLDVESLLPMDDPGDGFDNHAANLTISHTHIEKYLLAAELALEKAFPIASKLKHQHRYSGDQLRGNNIDIRDYKVLASNSNYVDVKLNGIAAGTYKVNLQAAQHKAGEVNAKLSFSLNGKQLGDVEVKSVYPKFKQVDLPNLKLKNGDRLSVQFINDFYREKPRLDRNVSIRSLSVDGSEVKVKQTLATKFQQKYRTLPLPGESERAFAERVLTAFSKDVFKHSRNKGNSSKYLRFIEIAKKNGETHLHGIRLAMQAMLLSQDFLFIDASHRHQNYAKSEHAGTSLISEQALAQRLSYFLWSAPPDQTLRDLVQKNELRAKLDEQIERMLADPKATALVDNFVGQWLQTRDLDSLRPDKKAFPSVNSADLDDLRSETQHLLKYIFLENKPLTDLINGDYSFLNENLADYYGIKNVKGSHFRKVSLAGTDRAGLLTHGSILMLTSTPTRTSPVMRGKWLLDNILDTPPPPPPGDIPELKGEGGAKGHLSLKEELELHREKPSCAACHKMMDPIGFAYESYDAIGKSRRTKIEDTMGELFTGEKFKDFTELQLVIAEQKREDFARCIVKKVLTYSLARSLEYYDKPTIDLLTQQLLLSNFSFHDLVKTTAKSIPFQTYRSH